MGMFTEDDFPLEDEPINFNELRKVETMLRNIDKYDIAIVTFNDSTRTVKQEYSYKMHASFKPAAGDTVIVQSPYAGLSACTVVRVMSKNAYGAERAVKWVVDKVDCRFHHTLIAEEAQRNAAKEAALRLAHKVNVVEQLITTLPAGSKAKKLLQQAVKAGGAKAFTMNITANISGYSDEGMLITYSIGSYGDTDKVEGATIHKVVTEYMRRKNWTTENKPMILIGSKTIDNDDQPDHGTIVVEV